MRSSSGEHYLALDHLRAAAAFMVFAWHFTHAGHGYPVPFAGTPLPPFSVLDEGHTGVALFMTLSGYLFAKLLADRRIHYGRFLYNRALRLLPLLLLVVVLAGLPPLRQGPLQEYLRSLATGLVLPTLPNGGWSITVELHFYVLLPALLFAARRSRALLLAIVLAAILFRYARYLQAGTIQPAAYWTIVGRIDQFALGMFAAYAGGSVKKPGLVAAVAGASLVAFYTWFNAAGGFTGMPSYPSPSPVWILLPTLEGLCYAAVIGWYDRFQRSTGRASRAFSKLGEWSYSIYLLHFFVVFQAAAFVHTRIMDISNFYLALAWAVPAFLLVALAAACSYRLVERPFLRFRKPYIKAAP